jgi:hypothetical protein
MQWLNCGSREWQKDCNAKILILLTAIFLYLLHSERLKNLKIFMSSAKPSIEIAINFKGKLMICLWHNLHTLSTFNITMTPHFSEILETQGACGGRRPSTCHCLIWAFHQDINHVCINSKIFCVKTETLFISHVRYVISSATCLLPTLKILQ